MRVVVVVIDRKNEEIDLLKIGLSGIAKRYGFQTVHDFTKPLPPLKQLMPIIRSKRTSGKKDMQKMQKIRKKKAYIRGYRIIIGKMQINK